MLFKRQFHDGSIDRTYRRWSRPQVKVGGRCGFGGGDLLEVTSLDQLPLGSITQRDARRAGFASREALLDTLQSSRSPKLTKRTKVFRVAFRYAGKKGDGPATDDDLSTEEVAELRARLDKMDRLSALGPWTLPTLKLTRSFEVGYELTPLGRRVLGG